MASNLLNTLEKIEKGRKKCIRLANEVNYPLPEDASLEQIAQCINAQGYADEYYESYKAWFTKDFSALPDGKVRLPDEIEKLGDRAFYYGSNIDIIWPRNLKTIGNYCFRNATFKNKTVIIPDTVTALGQYSFYECGDTNHTYYLNSNITKIESYCFDHAKGTMYYDGRVEDLSGSYIFGNSNAGLVGNGLKMHMTPESIACIKKMGTNCFGQCHLYQMPWNDTLDITGSSQFQNTIWHCPVVLAPNLCSNTGMPASMFSGAQFTQGFEWPSYNSDTLYASFSSAQFNNEVLKIPEDVKILNSGTFGSICKYTDGSVKTTPIPRIEVLSKDNLTFTNGGQFYSAKYTNLIIFAENVSDLPSQSLCQSSTGDPNGNIIFLNIKKVPAALSNTTFRAQNMSKGPTYIYLPDDLVATAKTMTNWSSVASYIKPLSQWPLYAEYAEHILPREGA